MVTPGEAPRQVELMTTTTVPVSSSSSPPYPSSVMLRGKPQSRFPLPILKNWGNQRFLRCVKVGGGNGASTSSPSTFPSDRKSTAPDDGFEQIRAKLMVHLREAADQIERRAVAPGQVERKDSVVLEEEEEDKSPAAGASSAPVSAAAAEAFPWNLRTRRAACNGRHCNPSPPPPVRPSPPPSAAKSVRLRSGVSEKNRRRPRFSVSLSKEEIEEDLYAVTGRMASRRPKKRSRTVQKQLDLIFPGLWLSEVTAASYQVPDPLPPRPS